MRTTLTIDDEMSDDLMQYTGERTQSAAVKKALEIYLAMVKRNQLLALRGQVPIDDCWLELRALERNHAA